MVAYFDRSLAEEAGDDLIPLVVLDEHVFAAAAVGTLDGEDHAITWSVRGGSGISIRFIVCSLDS